MGEWGEAYEVAMKLMTKLMTLAMAYEASSYKVRLNQWILLLFKKVNTLKKKYIIYKYIK